jgi:hypothetical protein
MRPTVRFTIGRLMSVVALVALLCWASTVLGPALFLIDRRPLLGIVIFCAGPCLGIGLVFSRGTDRPHAFLMGSIMGSLIVSGVMAVFLTGIMITSARWEALIAGGRLGRLLTAYAASVIGTTFLFVCAGVAIGSVFEVARRVASGVTWPFRKRLSATREIVESRFHVDRVRDLFGP